MPKAQPAAPRGPEAEIAFGKQLVKQYRIECGLRQEDLAELIDGSPSFISQLENGRAHKVGIHTLRKLSQVFAERLERDELVVLNAIIQDIFLAADEFEAFKLRNDPDNSFGSMLRKAVSEEFDRLKT